MMFRAAAALGLLMRSLMTACTAAGTAGRMLRRRQSPGRLGQLDDRTLRDIGLTREDLWSGGSEPLFRGLMLPLAGYGPEARMARRVAMRERAGLRELVRLWNRDSRAA